MIAEIVLQLSYAMNKTSIYRLNQYYTNVMAERADHHSSNIKETLITIIRMLCQVNIADQH